MAVIQALDYAVQPDRWINDRMHFVWAADGGLPPGDTMRTMCGFILQYHLQNDIIDKTAFRHKCLLPIQQFFIMLVYERNKKKGNRPHLPNSKMYCTIDENACPNALNPKPTVREADSV